jgi:hypothetical protein
MTDGLTDAVRRLKGLQEDVEQLKAAREQEGVPLIILQDSEGATASDAQAGLVASDFDVADTATAADAQTDLRLQGLLEPATYNRAGYVTSTYDK